MGIFFPVHGVKGKLRYAGLLREVLKSSWLIQSEPFTCFHAALEQKNLKSMDWTILYR